MQIFIYMNTELRKKTINRRNNNEETCQVSRLKSTKHKTAPPNISLTVIFIKNGVDDLLLSLAFDSKYAVITSSPADQQRP